MNRTELIERVADTAALDKRQAEAAVAAFVNTVIGATKGGEKVSIFGFGSFVPKDRAAREGRNPQTGAKVKIAASKAVGFTPAAAYKATLNTKGGAKKAGAKKTAPAKATPAKAAATKTTSKAPAAKSAASKVVASKVVASKVVASKTPASKAPASKAPAKKATTKAVVPAKKATKTTRK